MSLTVNAPESGVVGSPVPRLYVENRRLWQKTLSHDPVAVDAGVRVVERGGILPLRRDPDDLHKWAGGVVDADGSFVAGQLSDPERDANPRNIIHSYPHTGAWEHRPETVIWGGGRNIKHFGHALLEWPARLWWRIANESRLRVAFTIRGMTHNHPLIELLMRTGLSREDVLFIDQPTRFDKVIVPDQAFYPSGHFSPSESRRIYDGMRDSVPAGSAKKIYLTRSQLPAMPRVMTLNEEAVEAEFARRGFTIVAPEKLKLTEQISLLAGADEVATTGGTLSHMVAFCREGVKLHLLPRVHTRPRDPAVPRVQWSLNHMRNVDLSIVDAIKPAVFPATREWGVTEFGTTPHLERFLAVELDGHRQTDVRPVAPTYTDAELGRLLREWAALVERTPDHVRHAIPPITADGLAAAVSRVSSMEHDG